MRPRRLAFGPVLAAARSGRGILTSEAERAVDALFAGPLPESIGRSLAEHHVLERVAAGMLETESADGSVEELTHRVVQSPAFKRALADGVFHRNTSTLNVQIENDQPCDRAIWN